MSERYLKRLEKVEIPSFSARRRKDKTLLSPLVWEKAKGNYVWTQEYGKMLDLTASFGTALLGHRPDFLHDILTDPDGLITALGDLHPSVEKVELLEELARIAPWAGAKVGLAVSGSDANTIAMKTAILATGRSRFLSICNSYHGLAFGPLALSHYRKRFREPFQSVGADVDFLDLDSDLASQLESLKGDRYAGVIVEPIQGRGGVCVIDTPSISKIQDWAALHGAVVIADEILCGLGRCGRVWASDHWPKPPDLITVGKAMAGGLPLSACLGRDHIMEAWESEDSEAIHTGTFFSQPLCCRAALGCLGQLDEIVEKSALVEARVRAVVKDCMDKELVGAGCLLAVDFHKPLAGLHAAAFLQRNGVLALPCGCDAQMLQFLPTINFGDEEEEILGASLKKLERQLFQNEPPVETLGQKQEQNDPPR